MHSFFFFNDTATTEIYTLSLHDALPILDLRQRHDERRQADGALVADPGDADDLEAPRGLAARHEDVVADSEVVVLGGLLRSEEHTSELQSRQYLVCRLLLEKKKTNHITS